jgi:predicted CXXCH cytochrome family protein
MGNWRSACNNWPGAPRGVTFLVALFLAAALPLLLPAQSKNSCLDCHFALEPPLLVTQEQFAEDIHAQKGLNCASCHGGDPTNEDPAIAMGRAAGFRGKILRAQIPALCAKCHSDAAYMRQYNPSVRTDQFAQYQTSVHGKRLRQGDTKVAVCTDCHGLHETRPPTDARSKVHALNVAQTCAACHSKAEYLRGYSIPTDQFAGYSASVHHEALTVRGDLSAPNCTTCHGTHGAAPPGVASVEFVCATCHVFQAQLFDGSKHKPAFEAMGMGACVTCHSNHRIERPTDAMIGTGKDAVCLNCHSDGDPGYIGADGMHRSLQSLVTAITRSDEILGRAERSGMEVSQAKLEQAQARDALTKARVTIHSFDPKRVETDVAEGLKVADKTYLAGVAALQERDFRRVGLGVSLIAIVIVLIGLRLYIRKIETSHHSGAQV